MSRFLHRNIILVGCVGLWLATLCNLPPFQAGKLFFSARANEEGAVITEASPGAMIPATQHEVVAHEKHEAHAKEGGHQGGKHPPEPPDLLLVLGEHYTSGWLSEFLIAIRAPFYSFIVAALILWLFSHVARNLEKVPGRLQVFVEVYVQALDNFVCSILGKEIGRKYLPFLGTVAIYIWVMNLFCLIPTMMSPTAVVYQTFGLSICVFIYVQYTAIRYQGVGGYIFHLANEPRDLIGYCLAPLFLPLHTIGELIKPVSLGLRLWGNILGEGILLGVFSALGLMVMPSLASLVGWHFEHAWIGIPLHFPLMFLVLLGSTIQAMVFLSLSTIYISLVMPHHEEHDGHAPEGAH
jgi:F-type H+-transporting ATPase subunit a